MCQLQQREGQHLLSGAQERWGRRGVPCQAGPWSCCVIWVRVTSVDLHSAIWFEEFQPGLRLLLTKHIDIKATLKTNTMSSWSGKSSSYECNPLPPSPVVFLCPSTPEMWYLPIFVMLQKELIFCQNKRHFLNLLPRFSQIWNPKQGRLHLPGKRGHYPRDSNPPSPPLQSE